MSPTFYAPALFLLLVGEVFVLADDPAEELPPPAAVRQDPDWPVTGQQGTLEPEGWGLAGPRGQHYFFGRTATADYRRDGRQSIVTLEQEDAAPHVQADPRFLYYREVGAGHRWAFGRQPTASDEYVVYFQSAGKRTWTLFHKARLNWVGLDIDPVAEASCGDEPSCGGETSVLRRAP